jgi:hypothetical protein
VDEAQSFESRSSNGLFGSDPPILRIGPYIRASVERNPCRPIVSRDATTMSGLTVEASRNAPWRRSENLVSGNGRAVAIGVERGIVDAGVDRLTRRIGRNASPN